MHAASLTTELRLLVDRAELDSVAGDVAFNHDLRLLRWSTAMLPGQAVQVFVRRGDAVCKAFGVISNDHMCNLRDGKLQISISLNDAIVWHHECTEGVCRLDCLDADVVNLGFDEISYISIEQNARGGFYSLHLK